MNPGLITLYNILSEIRERLKRDLPARRGNLSKVNAERWEMIDWIEEGINIILKQLDHRP